MRWLFISSKTKLIGPTPKDQYWKWKEKGNREEAGRGGDAGRWGQIFIIPWICDKPKFKNLMFGHCSPCSFLWALPMLSSPRQLFLSGFFFFHWYLGFKHPSLGITLFLCTLLSEHSEPCRLIQQITFRAISLQFLRNSVSLQKKASKKEETD